MIFHPITCCGTEYDGPEQHANHLYDAHSAWDMAAELATRAQQLANEHATSAERARIAADLRQQLADAKARIAAVRALHHPVNDRSGWGADDDDTPGSYGTVSPACAACGAQDMATRWPCPTVAALAGQAEQLACCVCGSSGASYFNHLGLAFCPLCADCQCGQEPCERVSGVGG